MKTIASEECGNALQNSPRAAHARNVANKMLLAISVVGPALGVASLFVETTFWQRVIVAFVYVSLALAWLLVGESLVLQFLPNRDYSPETRSSSQSP